MKAAQSENLLCADSVSRAIQAEPELRGCKSNENPCGRGGFFVGFNGFEAELCLASKPKLPRPKVILLDDDS
jgi:hypothetical protein